jgi:hypothetical protein
MCAVLDDGSVKCWGKNSDGQLGYGDTVQSGDGAGEMGDALPAVALGTGRTAVSIEAGSDHTCAVLDDRSVKCWGANGYGQLGSGALVGGKLSLEGSGTGCTCVAGHTAEANGMACTACVAGTYKASVGLGSCTPCNAGSESPEGAASCYCAAGFRSSGYGQCEACEACVSPVTLYATLSMSLSDFDSAKRAAYIAGVARALLLAPSAVAISSVSELGSRRRLLTSAVVVETTATVTPSPCCTEPRATSLYAV